MKRFLPLPLIWACLVVSLLALPAGAQPTSPSPQTAEAEAPHPSPIQVYAHTFEHRSASDASTLVSHRLSPRGAVEVQPGSNTLVVRDIASVIPGIRRTIESFDVPPATLRFDVQLIRAGSQEKSVISPAPDPPASELDPAIASRLHKLLRYETYDIVAAAEVSAREGDGVDYALGERYALSFRLGDLMGQRRLRLRDFHVVERPSASADKSRRAEPRSLFDAHLNLWLDRPFTLVLTRDEERGEALLVVLSVEREATELSAAAD